MPTIQSCYSESLSMGCDPELFLTQNGSVIGSERVIPETGITSDGRAMPGIIRDGIQVELNPPANTCRAYLGISIALLLRCLKTQLGTTTQVSFDPVVTVPAKEFEGLSPKSRELGCMPSLNLYDAKATITQEASTSLVRSAGGHIHLGNLMVKNPPDLIPLLDIILGNTCVLIDRDPHAAARRMNYGRAGEYRLPKHGLEYRTLSNFWLRSYQLTSFVTGMARFAYEVLRSSEKITTSHNNPQTPYHFAQDLLNRVQMSKVVEAINTNNRDLAWETWQILRGFIEEFVVERKENSIYGGLCWPLSKTKMEDFEFFLTKPLDHWFPDDPMMYWTEKFQTSSLGHYDSGHIDGWESFLTTRVRNERLQARPPIVPAAVLTPVPLIEQELNIG